MSSGAEQDWLMEAAAPQVVEFYARIGVALPARDGTQSSVRCFANAGAHSHEDRQKSCSVSLLTGLWKCHGCGMSGNPYQAALATNCGDVQARQLAQSYGLFLEPVKRETPKLPNERMLKKWRHDLRGSQIILKRLEVLKGWTPYAIQRLGLGWDGERLTFAIRDGSKTKPPVGVVRYLPGGKPKTLALPGSKRGLFPAPERIHVRHPIFLVEGEPDAVSVWSTGHRAVAIPGAGSWRPDWAKRLVGRQVIILPDCDPQGRQLAERVAGDVAGARIVDIEPGASDGTDIGDWVREASREGGLRQMFDLLGRLLP